MSDDLVERAAFALSDMQGRIDAGKLKMFQDCIDRIEELEAKLSKAMQIIEAYEEDEGYVPRRVVSLYEELSSVSCANLKGQSDE